MEQLVRDLITGFVSAGLYALMAAGLVLTYSTTRIFNLGFAGVAFSAAYTFFEDVYKRQWRLCRKKTRQ